MKHFEFQTIGNYERLSKKADSGEIIRIMIKKELKNALIKLDHFSHGLLFTKEDCEIHCYVFKILEINEKSGELLIETAGSASDIRGELADIKPYFPCEEAAEGYQDRNDLKTGTFLPIAFRGNAVGEYIFANNNGMLQFCLSETLSENEIDAALDRIQAGDILRILWWFHRFDGKIYRSHVMCNPPYENAPKSGVFATRSPVRPNPLASTIVKVKAVDRYNHRISVLGFDGFEHSMILQVMPYQNDRVEDIRVPKWVEHWTEHKVFYDNSEISITVGGYQNIQPDGEAAGVYQSIQPEGDAVSSYRNIQPEGEAVGATQSIQPDGEDTGVYRSTQPDDKVVGTYQNTQPGEEAAYFTELEGEDGFEQDYIDTNEIIVENASLHNLRDVSVRIPKGKITVITGVSGSGKSTLAFDTIYHESQKQFIDLVASNSPLGSDLKDSKVKRITGLQPSIAIEQKNLGTNPRSTVASLSRTGEYLRLLFSTIGERVCPNCGEIIPNNNVCVRCGAIYFPLTPATFSYNHPEYMCPVCKGLGEELQIDIGRIVSNPEKSILDGASAWWGNLRKFREEPNANWMKGEVLALAADIGEDLEVPFKDLSEAFKQQIFYGSNGRKVTLSYEISNGRSGTITRPAEGVVNILQRLLVDNSVNRTMDQMELFMVNKQCSRCHGERLLEEGRLVRIRGTRYPEAARMSITHLKKWCHTTYGSLNQVQKDKSRAILTKLIAGLKKLEQVGLGYINLDRSIPSLSGGEAQRLKIATQFGTGLSNILYVMDEPSKGLHPRDYSFLIKTIKDLKKQNNTILIVEHKKEFIQMADYLVEIGPGAGQYGGRLLRAEAVEKAEPLAGSDHDDYAVKEKILDNEEKLVLNGARTNNLKNIDISIPLSKFICVIGVSGSGKSSLISKTLYPAIQKELGIRSEAAGEYVSITGADRIKDICYVSQNAIGKNSRSNPGTYTGVFDLIRDFYANLSEAKKAKLTREHFSFNSSKGQCVECKGAGEIAIPMHYMPDIYTTCSKCNGRRYQEHILKVQYKGYSIADLLELEICQVKELFKTEAKIYEILDMLDKVGLSYIKLGQSAATLSGGEAQRIKLAKELCGSRTKDVIYILDEPTTGLHDEDVMRLSFIIHELTSKGSTVIVIEHNPQLIGQADYLIELGPEGGERGGYILKEGWLERA